MEIYRGQNIFEEWFYWQFAEMPGFLFSVWKNYIFFALDFFSVPLLVKSLLAPWRRYRWVYPKRFDPKEFFNTLISNAFSRILGCFCRILLIILGVIFQIFVLSLGAIVFLAWFLIPFAIVAMILFAIFY